MSLVLSNRVQETATANTTVSFTLAGAVSGFQSFTAIGNGNTTYYSATDSSGNWEVGLGTYSTTGPTLTRTTVYESSNSGSAVTFSGSVNVFVTYPSGRSVNLDASGNVSALGNVTSGAWQGSTVAVAYGGTGVTSSTGPNSVVLRDADGNVKGINNVEVGLTLTTSAGGITTMTAAATQIQILTGTANQTYKLPDATTLQAGTFYTFGNSSSGVLTVTDHANAVIETISQGGAAQILCLSAATVGGTWGYRVFASSNTTWGNSFLDYPGAITSAEWQGDTVSPAYGGTGLTTFTAANNALYSTAAGTLTAGTLPVLAGGTGVTTSTGSGDVVLSISPTLVTPALGSPTSGNFSTGTFTWPTFNQNTTGTSANVTGIVAVANGGTGTATPSLVAGTNVTISGSWPNQTINASGGGGGGGSVVGDIFVGATIPSTGTWLEAGNYYSKATYPALAAVVGNFPDVGKGEVLFPQTRIENISFTAPSAVGTSANNFVATNGTGTIVIAGNGTFLVSTDNGVTFSPVSSRNNSQIRSVKYLNGYFVATTANGLCVSADGITWKITITGNSLADSAYGAGKWVTAGNSGFIYYSTDLTNWIQAPIVNSAATSNYLIFDNSVFVLTSSVGVFYSSDGITWLSGFSGVQAWAVIYAGGYFVVATDLSYRYSTNGITWTTVSLGVNVYDVAYNGSAWLFTTNAASYVYATSIASATTYFSPAGTGAVTRGIAWDGSRWILGASLGRWAVSTNGTTWTIISDYTGNTFQGIERLSGKTFIAGTTSISTISGNTRFPIINDAGTSFNSALVATASPVAYGNSVYVLAPNSSNLAGQMLYSSDGKSWTSVLVRSNTTTSMNKVLFLNNTFVAIGNAELNSETLYISSSGVTWQVITTNPQAINDATYAAGNFVLVGNAGKIYSGTNLGLLSFRSAGTNAFTSVAYGAGVFVAVGASGTIYSSPDAITWTSRSGGVFQTINKVIYENSLFVAVGGSAGGGAEITTSSDGITWQQRNPASTSLVFNDVVWNGSIFVTVGSSSGLAYSTNGTTWFRPTAFLDSTNTYKNVYWTGSRFIAFASNNFGVAISTDGIKWTRSGATSSIIVNSSLTNGVIFAASTTNLFYSSDGGLTWQLTKYSPNFTTNFTKLYKLGDYYYALGSNGIFYSSDGFNFLSVDTINSPIVGMAYNGTTWMAVATTHNNRPAAAFISTNGVTFTKSAQFGTTLNYASYPSLLDVAYASGYFIIAVSTLSILGQIVNVIYRSTNGVSWEPAPVGGNLPLVGSIGSSGSKFVYSNNTYVAESSDGGSTENILMTLNSNIGVAHNNGAWLLSTSSAAYASTDLIKFVQIAQNNVPITGIYYDGRYMIAIGVSGSSGLKIVFDSVSGNSWAQPLPSNFAINSTSILEELVLRDGKLLYPQSASTTLIPIVEFPLYSYNTTTTFFVPYTNSQFGSKTWIYAGP